MNWRPTKELKDNIVSAGVDIDFLNDLLSGVKNYDQNLPSLAAAKQFVAEAVTAQISWENSFGSEDLEYIQPKTYMKKSWRPKEETIQLLLSQLEYNRVKVGFIREFFKKENQGNMSRSWDCLFVKYALVYFENETKYTEESRIVEKREIEKVPEAQRFVNKLRVQELVSDVLKESYISLFFNYSLSSNWQPAKWVVNKLHKSNISKRFIYDDTILIPFRSYFETNASLNRNINIEYFHWVIKRFRINHNLLLKEKEALERRLNDIN